MLEPETRCYDACGAAVEKPEQVGWFHLEATGRWRCPQCARALAAANTPKDPDA